VHTHLEGEGRLEDDVHRAEVTEASEKQFRTQMILDKIAEKHEVQVSQEELTQYLIQSSAQYGMSPQDFVNALQEGNQIPMMVGEVARNKALAVALGKVNVVDTNGKKVDLAGFAAEDDEAADEATEAADEKPAAKKAPAKKAPAKKPAAKKTDDADDAADEKPAAKKAPARKPAAKKADADAAEEPAKKAPAKRATKKAADSE